MNRQTKPIRFKYEEAKATQVILWFLHRHGITDKLKLVKMVFFADREHLARYGRPIVGGAYCAMPYGPVSSELLNHIDKINDEKNPPFVLRGYQLHPQSQFNEDYLSESDVEILEEVDNKYGKCDPFTLSNITHQLKAYKKHCQKNTHTSVPLPYEDFFLDLDDRSILDIIREDQASLADLE